MTNHTDHTTATETDPNAPKGRRAVLGLAGAGLAGAVALGRGTSVAANDGDPVSVGGDFSGDTATRFTNTTANADIAGPANAIKGSVSSATNGSHAILATTVGTGHAIAGVVGTPANPTGNGVGATWGRHYGPGAAVEGQSKSKDQPIAGPANGVKGTVDEATNGSHAVLGITMGGGHAVAGDTPADAPNTVAATWGRHGGAGAGIGGISAGGYGGEFVGGRAQVRLIQEVDADNAGAPTTGEHKLGELYADGAGDLFYNQDDGLAFTKLTQQNVLLDDPVRVYDSRDGREPTTSQKGATSDGEIRVVDVSAIVDTAGARAAMINLTVTETDAAGYLSVFNGDTDDAEAPDTSSINWFQTGTTMANGLTVRLGADGTVKVRSKNSTHFIIDVTGFIA